MVDWDDVGYVMASRPRFAVASRLRAGRTSPRELSERLGIPLSHVSLALKQLQERDLAECLTPDLRKGRIYALTAKGEKVLDEIVRMTKRQNHE